MITEETALRVNFSNFQFEYLDSRSQLKVEHVTDRSNYFILNVKLSSKNLIKVN